MIDGWDSDAVSACSGGNLASFEQYEARLVFLLNLSKREGQFLFPKTRRLELDFELLLAVVATHRRAFSIGLVWDFRPLRVLGGMTGRVFSKCVGKRK